MISAGAVKLRDIFVACLDAPPCSELIGWEGASVGQPCCCSNGSGPVLRFQLVEVRDAGFGSGAPCKAEAVTARWEISAVMCAPQGPQADGSAQPVANVTAVHQARMNEGWRVFQRLAFTPGVRPESLRGYVESGCVGWVIVVEIDANPCRLECDGQVQG